MKIYRTLKIVSLNKILFYTVIFIVFSFHCNQISSQNNLTYTKLGVINSVNNNNFDIFGCGTNRGLEFIYFTTPWLTDKYIKIDISDLGYARGTVSYVESKFEEWNKVIAGKGFKGRTKPFDRRHFIYTKGIYDNEWNPKRKQLTYNYFVDLLGGTCVEVEIIEDEQESFCFYLTNKSVKQFSYILRNAESIFLKSKDLEFDNLLK